MRTLRYLALAALLATGAPASAQAAAVDAAKAAPAAPHFQATVYPARVAASSLFRSIGEALLEDDFGELIEMVEAYQEIVGVDPRTDITKVRLDAQVDVQVDMAALANATPALKRLAVEAVDYDLEVELETTGNLAGILLAIPGYDGRTEHRDGVLHEIDLSMLGEATPSLQLWHTTVDGATLAIASTSKDRLDAKLTQRDAGDDSEPAGLLAKVVVADPETSLAELYLPDLSDAAPDSVGGMLSVAATRSLGLIQRAELSLSQQGDAVAATLVIDSLDEFAAEQLRSALAAGVGVLKAMDREMDSKEHRLLTLANQLAVSSEGNRVTIAFRGKDVGVLLKVLQDL